MQIIHTEVAEFTPSYAARLTARGVAYDVVRTEPRDGMDGEHGWTVITYRSPKDGRTLYVTSTLISTAPDGAGVGSVVTDEPPADLRAIWRALVE